MQVQRRCRSGRQNPGGKKRQGRSSMSGIRYVPGNPGMLSMFQRAELVVIRRCPNESKAVGKRAVQYAK